MRICVRLSALTSVSSMSISSTVATLEDSGQLQGHGPTVAAVQLLPAICIKVIKRTKHCKRLRTYSGHIIGSVSDLFLQSDKDVIAKNTKGETGKLGKDVYEKVGDIGNE
eukprot:1073557_1